MGSGRVVLRTMMLFAVASSCRLTPFSDEPPISYDNAAPAPAQPMARGGGPIDVNAAPAPADTSSASASPDSTTASTTSPVAPPYLQNEGTGFFAPPSARGGGPPATSDSSVSDTSAPPTARGGGQRAGASSNANGGGSTNFFSGPPGRPADAPPARPADAPPPAAIAPPVMEAGANRANANPATPAATTGTAPAADVNATNATPTAAAGNTSANAAAPADTNAATPPNPTARSNGASPATANGSANANGSSSPRAAENHNGDSRTAPSNDAQANNPARWANRGPSGTPVAANTPGSEPSQSQQHGNEPATPEPVHEEQFVLRAPSATSIVTPPTHPGAQPILVAVDGRCDEAPPACAIEPGLASGYGWSVCVKPRSACSDDPNNTGSTQPIDHAALRDAVQRLGSARGADVQSANTIVAASGDRANALLASAPPADAPTREVLLVEPDTARDITLAGTLPFTRIAWIDGVGAPTGREKRDALADQLAQRGISFAAITPKDRSDRARHEAVIRALAWLRAGDDSRVCDATPSRTTRVTVRCNGIGDDARASR